LSRQKKKKNSGKKASTDPEKKKKKKKKKKGGEKKKDRRPLPLGKRRKFIKGPPLSGRGGKDGPRNPERPRPCGRKKKPTYIEKKKEKEYFRKKRSNVSFASYKRRGEKKRREKAEISSETAISSPGDREGAFPNGGKKGEDVS